MQLNEAVVLVFGGASGLGAATAARLAHHGARPVIADVRPSAGEYPAMVSDVCDPAQVQAAIDLAQQHGVLRAVVHSAGILRAARILGRDGPHDLDVFRQVIEINLIGAFNVCRLAAAAMAHNPPQAGERGVLIQTASIAAWEGQVGQTAYAASKAGVAGMVLPMARELGKLGIRVMGIAPGVFETPMMQAAPPEVRESLYAQIPFPARFGRPEEYAALALHILENPMLNGSVIRLDGGLRMQPR